MWFLMINFYIAYIFYTTYTCSSGIFIFECILRDLIPHPRLAMKRERDWTRFLFFESASGRERQRDRETETERQSERQSKTHRETERKRERQSETQRERNEAWFLKLGQRGHCLFRGSRDLGLTQGCQMLTLALFLFLKICAFKRLCCRDVKKSR